MDFTIKLLETEIKNRVACIRVSRKDSEQAKRAAEEIKDLEEALNKLKEQ